ncbi:MAG: hypothetical protein HFJ79_05185 [Clostridiales bacterium]|jgi:hypothetical protein|nr:hypothetical protein [Clostridiales bacterium]
MEPFIRRLLTAVFAIFLIGYVTFQGVQIFYNPIRTETVKGYSVYDTIDTDGITIRNETLVPGDTQGYLFFETENGGRVGKGGHIAQVFPSEQDALAQQKLNTLDDELKRLEEINRQGTANKANLELINKQIERTMMEMVWDVHSSSLVTVTQEAPTLLSLLNKYQITTGKVNDFTDRISSLKQTRDQLASSFSKATATIEAPVAGYFVSTVDGFESRFTYDDVLKLRPEQITEALNAPEDPEAGSGYVGKMVADYEWYLACTVPAEKADTLYIGASLTVRLPFVSQEAIPVTVMAMNRDKDGNTAVIFQCSYMSSSLSSIRREPIQIQKTLYEGIRVPQKAITFGENGERGVYVRVGNTAVLRKIDIIYSDPDFVISREVKEGDEGIEDPQKYLRMYDDVIVEGKGLYDGKSIA